MEYHELNPLIRGKELELLSNETFERLIQASSINEIKEILNTTSYHSTIDERFENDFEQKLANEQSQLFSWLHEVSPEPQIIWIYTMRYTFHNLKVLTKAKMTNKNLNHLFINDGFYSIGTLKDAIQTYMSTELPKSVLASIREVHEYFKESAILQGIDVIYDRYFFEEQRRLGEQLGYQELLKAIISFIDLTNISTMARGIQQRRSLGFMTTVISSFGSIPKEAFLIFVQGEMTDYLAFLEETDYQTMLKPVIHDKEIDLVRFEQIKDNYLSSLYQEAQTQAFGPLPLLALLNAKEIERKNLRVIITGKKNHFSKKCIRERMRQVYDA